MRRFWAATALVLLATALVIGVGTAHGIALATPGTLTVEVTGHGTVTGTGVNCGEGSTDCFAGYSSSTGVTLTATAAAGWHFLDWGGSSTDTNALNGTCIAAGPNPCTVTVAPDEEHLLTANFAADSGASPSHTLSVSVPHDAQTPSCTTGCGEVKGGDIGCGSAGTDCSWTVVDGSTITLVETPDGGFNFNGWGGDCSGTGLTCTLEMTADHSVTANFSSASTTAALTVTVAGNGTVTGGGITCGSGATCTANEPNGSSVTLTAQPASGYTFIGWGATGGATGDCTGTQNTCTVQMSAAHSVTATFATTFELKVSVTGSGNVSGGSGVGAINCGNGPSQCSGDEQQDKTVTLTAAAAFGSSFLGWSGACTGVTTSCTITMNTDKTVSASFRSTTFPLSVSVSGTGSVSGGGITCGGGAFVCNADVTANSTVTLTATPGSGAAFTAWSGACSGALTSCTFSMTSAKSVTATFSTGTTTTPPPPPTTVPLSVSVSGNGSVTGGGLSCGNGAGVCTANETVNSTVTLLATPARGAKFQGWGGACSGTQTTCSVSATAAVSVSATFTGGTAGPTLTIKVGGKGTVTAPAGKCTSGGSGKTCAQRYSAGTAVTLKAAAAKGARFLGWSGACAGKKLTCVVTLKASRTAVAGFSGAVKLKRGAVLQAVGSPVVKRAGSRFLVTLHFQTTLAGTARVQGLRAGRVLTALSFRVRAGADTVGPFPVAVPGFFTFLVTLVDRAGRSHTIQWQACLGSCGARAPASAGMFAVTREKPTIKRAGTAWLVTLRFRETQPSGAEVLVLRHGSVVADLNFAPGGGEVSLGPFVLAPGDYSIRVTATDAFGRVRHLSFSAVLAR